MYNPISLGSWRPVLTRQPPGVTKVALTFDDGPTPETTPIVLRLLAAARAQATFFLTGVRVAAYPELVHALVADGHAVYGHAWEHQNFERMPTHHAADAMRKVEDALVRFRPTPSPYLLRLPYNAGHNRSRMHRAMTHFQPDIRFVYYTFSAYDYMLANGCETREALEQRCYQTAQKLCGHPSLAGSIILMHEKAFDNEEPLNPAVIGTLLPHVLEGIAARGLPIGLIEQTAISRPLDRFLLLRKAPREPAPTAWS